MDTTVLRPPTVAIGSPSGLAPDLVHTDVVRTPGGAEFAVGWVDDTPPTSLGAERQKEGT